MTIRLLMSPNVSSATMVPHSSRSVSGRINGESRESSRTVERQIPVLPPPIVIQIREDTAAGELSTSTRLRV